MQNQNKPKLFRLKTVGELDNTPVEWLIPGWLPYRGITLLCSDGGMGKSYLWVSIASALSKGNRTILHDGYVTDTEKKILCFSGEDSESVLRSRFEKANAKGENIYVVAQDTDQPNITFGCDALEEMVTRVKPSLIIFDPLQSFIGAGVDMSRRNQMRQAMKPLMKLSSDYGCAVLVVVHTNKRQLAESGRDKMADSADLWDIARSVIMIGMTVDKQRYISLEKSNYGNHLDVDTVLFNLDSGRVSPCGRVNKKMSDFIQDRKYLQREETKTVSKKKRCMDEIVAILAENDGTIEANTLENVLLDRDFSKSTIRDAKFELKSMNMLALTRDSKGTVTYRKNRD